MKPVEPILPGCDLPVTRYAETQEEYQTLPVYHQEDGTLLSRWRLTWRERLLVLFTGNIYLWQLTFNQPLQPVMLEVEPPEMQPAPAAKPHCKICGDVGWLIAARDDIGNLACPNCNADGAIPLLLLFVDDQK